MNLLICILLKISLEIIENEKGKYLADEEVLMSLPGTRNPLPTRSMGNNYYPDQIVIL